MVGAQRLATYTPQGTINVKKSDFKGVIDAVVEENKKQLKTSLFWHFLKKAIIEISFIPLVLGYFKDSLGTHNCLRLQSIVKY